MLRRGEPGQKVYGNFCTIHTPSVSALWMLAFSVRGSTSKDTGSWPGCIILYKRSEHSRSFVSAGGPGTNLPHILGATIFFRFLLSLKLFPNKQFILNALPHVRESSAPWISADGEESLPAALRECPPLTLSLWNLGRAPPLCLLSAGRPRANYAGNAGGVQETFVEGWR